MKTFELNSEVILEGINFPDTEMGTENIVEIKVINPYPSRIKIEAIPQDQDLHILFCPEFLEGNDSAIIKVKYSPSRVRTESLNNKEIHFKIAL